MASALRLVSSAASERRRRADGPPEVSLLEQWNAYMLAYGCTPATAGVRVRTVSALIAHAGVTDPLDLTRDDTIAFLARGISAWSRLTYWKNITKWSEYLREFRHDLGSHLTEGVPKPRTPRAVARPIDDATIERLLALRLPPRAHAYIRLALYQALRVHEIAKVAAEDFDFATGWLMVTGKGGNTRPIPVHPEIAKLACGFPEIGYWFPSPVGKGAHVQARAVTDTIGNALKLAGSNATAHQLRDSAATRMQRQVKDIRITQSMLRHSSIGSTMKYTEASDEGLRRAVNSLDWYDDQSTRRIHEAADNGFLDSAGPVNPSEMSTEQLRALVGQLAATLAGREGSR